MAKNSDPSKPLPLPHYKVEEAQQFISSHGLAVRALGEWRAGSLGDCCAGALEWMLCMPRVTLARALGVCHAGALGE